MFFNFCLHHPKISLAPHGVTRAIARNYVTRSRAADLYARRISKLHIITYYYIQKTRNPRFRASRLPPDDVFDIFFYQKRVLYIILYELRKKKKDFFLLTRRRQKLLFLRDNNMYIRAKI